MVEFAYLLIIFPLIGFLINGLLGYKIKNELISGSIGSIAILFPFIISVIIFFDLLSVPPESRTFSITLFSWIQVGEFNFSAAYLIDPLSVIMSLIVTGVGFLIHIYSIGYMNGDKGFSRFFAFMNLFIFFMLNLVLADNFLLMFLGWEGVGLCSYLLIGFYYEKNFTGDAANKAFWVNRIGDFGFILAIFFIFQNFKTLNFLTLFNQISEVQTVLPVIQIITVLLFIGAIGKSAQIPLFVWLPDAMAGPTPVSALIHAATMVTAGVYMVARCSLLFVLSPFTMNLILVIGTLTALMAASIAVTQNDIKKILAYSTISQLGLMLMALGVGAFSTAIFHVTTHAFFKALLFLGAGSVIHALHHEQDIRRMGGLKGKLKITFVTFLLGGIAISGIPPFSGFFSKDEIFVNIFASGNYLFYIFGILTAFMTAFYIFRLIALTFYGNIRYDYNSIAPHESPKSMTIPLVILSFLSVIGGFIGLPHIISINAIGNFLSPVFEPATNYVIEKHLNVSTDLILIVVSVSIAVLGIMLAMKRFKTGNYESKYLNNKLYRLLENKYYVDEIYNKVIVKPIRDLAMFLYSKADIKFIDAAVDGTGRFFTLLSSDWRKLQTGVIQDYAIFSVAGIIAILLYILLR